MGEEIEDAMRFTQSEKTSYVFIYSFVNVLLSTKWLFLFIFSIFVYLTDDKRAFKWRFYPIDRKFTFMRYPAPSHRHKTPPEELNSPLIVKW